MKPTRNYKTRCLLLITSTLLWTGCASVPVKCNLPAFPVVPAEVRTEKAGCPDGRVCFTDEGARALGLWFRDLARWRQAAEACNH